LEGRLNQARLKLNH